MEKHKSSLTAGELLWIILFASVPALLVAMISFVGAVFFCAWLFRGPMAEWGTVLAPATGLFFGATAFSIAFRWISNFSRHAPGDHHGSTHPKAH